MVKRRFRRRYIGATQSLAEDLVGRAGPVNPGTGATSGAEKVPKAEFARNRNTIL